MNVSKEKMLAALELIERNFKRKFWDLPKDEAIAAQDEEQKARYLIYRGLIESSGGRGGGHPLSAYDSQLKPAPSPGPSADWEERYRGLKEQYEARERVRSISAPLPEVKEAMATLRRFINEDELKYKAQAALAVVKAALSQITPKMLERPIPTERIVGLRDKIQSWPGDMALTSADIQDLISLLNQNGPDKCFTCGRVSIETALSAKEK